MSSYKRAYEKVKSKAGKHKSGKSSKKKRATGWKATAAVELAPQRNFSRGDLKVCDFPLNGALTILSLNSTPQHNCINTVQVGSGLWNRIGNDISMKSVHVKGCLVLTGNAAIAGADEYLRIMLVSRL